MTDTEKLEQMLDQIEEMVCEMDCGCIYQSEAASHLRAASTNVSAAIRQEKINQTVDLCDTLGDV